MSGKKKVLYLILFLIFLNAGAILWLVFFNSEKGKTNLTEPISGKTPLEKNEEFSYGKVVNLGEGRFEYLQIESDGKLLPKDQRVNKTVFYDEDTDFYSVWDFRADEDEMMTDDSLTGSCDQRIGSCPADKEYLRIGYYVELKTVEDKALMVKIR